MMQDGIEGFSAAQHMVISPEKSAGGGFSVGKVCHVIAGLCNDDFWVPQFNQPSAIEYRAV